MTTRFDELIIPGLFDSGPDHWQSHWLRTRPQALKVELGAWDAPDPELWTARLDRAIARRRLPVFLIAHSLGCHTVARWADEAAGDRLNKVRAALLVAPPDVDRPDAHRLIRGFAPAPRAALPFPALLVASRTDPHGGFARIAGLAHAWGAELVDAGDAGHLNVESDIGDWPDGIALLDRLRDERSGRPVPPAARIAGRPAIRPRGRRA